MKTPLLTYKVIPETSQTFCIVAYMDSIEVATLDVVLDSIDNSSYARISYVVVDENKRKLGIATELYKFCCYWFKYYKPTVKGLASYNRLRIHDAADAIWKKISISNTTKLIDHYTILEF